jgi:hypothetical protein
VSPVVAMVTVHPHTGKAEKVVSVIRQGFDIGGSVKGRLKDIFCGQRGSKGISLRDSAVE